MLLPGGVKLGLGARARSCADLVTLAEAAVAEGFEHFWAYDSGRCIETVVALSYVALSQPSLVVGTATTNTETRDPAVLANALATLSNLTSGRVICGIGLGDSAVRFLGRRPTRIAVFKERLKEIRALLAGESVTCNGRPYRLPDPPLKPPLLLISAEGPTTCALAATAADGAILSLGASPTALAHFVAQLRESALAVGRDPNQLYVCVWLQAAMATTRSAAIETLRPQAGRTLLAALKHVPDQILASTLPRLDSATAARVRDLSRQQGDEFHLAHEIVNLLGEAALTEFTVVGTASDCHERLCALLAVPGVSELAINVYGTGLRAAIHDFATEVLGPIASQAPFIGVSST